MFKTLISALIFSAISINAMAEVATKAPAAKNQKVKTKKNSAPKKIAETPTRDFTTSLVLPHEKITLANGLTVILAQDHSTPFVAVSTWYHVGAIHEDAHRTGLAHLFEHLMFEGTRHFKAGDKFRLLENAGAADINASTSFDHTNYYQTVPKNQLELALWVESSAMFWLKITQERLDEQRAVVRREREQRLEVTPYGTAAMKLWQELFPAKHPFHGQVIGSHRDLQAADIDDIQGFYDKHYGPTNATLALVGDFQRDEAIALINKYYSTLPTTAKTPMPVLPKIELKNEEIIRVDEKIGKLTLIRMQYLSPGLFLPGDADMDLLAHILTGTQNGRLTKAITRDRPFASSVSAYQQSFGQTSVFTIDAVLNHGADENDAIKEIDRVLADLAVTPFTSQEIERAKNYMFTLQLFGLQNLGGYSGRAELLQTYDQYTSKPDYLKEDMLRFQKVDNASLVHAAKTYLPVGKARKILIAKPSSLSVASRGN